MLENRNSGRPTAAARRLGSLRSLLYEQNPSMSVTSRPASSAARVIASMHSRNSGRGDCPQRKYSLSPTPTMAARPRIVRTETTKE